MATPCHYQNEIKTRALNTSGVLPTNPVSHFAPRKTQSYITISRCGLCAPESASEKDQNARNSSPRAIASRRFCEGSFFSRASEKLRRPPPTVNTISKAPFLCQKAQEEQEPPCARAVYYYHNSQRDHPATAPLPPGARNGLMEICSSSSSDGKGGSAIQDYDQTQI
jgi:hypothetical protein